jgi:chaperonin GroEL
MEQKYNAPKITKDGVSIAEEVKISDRFEDLGAQLLKDITQKANSESGDGTTASTVLAYSILSEAIKRVSSGCDANDVRKGVLLATNKVVEYLETVKKEVSSGEELKQIAVVSCNGDEHLGSLISDAVEAVGKDGIISIEKGNKMVDELEVKKGIRFNEGFINPQFGNLKNPNTKVELENPLILLHRGDIKHSQHILPSLSHAQREGRPLLIISEGLYGDALAIALLNKLRGQVNVVAVRAPGFGDARIDYFHDLEAATGATLVDIETGVVASTATRQLFGGASSVTVSANETVIVGGKGDPEAVNERVEIMRHRLDQQDLSVGDREQMSERLAKLTSGAAVVRVGGGSQLEVKEKKDRLDDALGATYSALKNGFVPGGGVALFKASKALESMDTEGLSFDTKVGLQVVQKALAEPFNRILSNSGIDGSILLSRLGTEFSIGVDARTGEVVDMYQAGIIDPFNTVKGSLTNAAGVTSLLATTEVAIIRVLGNIEGFDGH